MKRWIAVFVTLALGAGLAHAADGVPLFKPDGVFVDGDRATRFVVTVPGNRAGFRKTLNRAIQKNPRNVRALVERAHLFMEGGDIEHAKRDFDAAFAAAEPGSVDARNVLWSRGWSFYDIGDFATAGTYWQRAVVAHGGRPHWASYTFALLYWSAGQRDLAFAWYGAAAASHPDWRSAQGVSDRTRNWSPEQQSRMLALFTGWAASHAG